MTQRFTLLNNQRGFTIIEVMVGALILVVGILGVTTMANTANVESSTAKARVGGTNLAREVLENAREFDYDELAGDVPAGSDTSFADALTAVGLADANGSASGWQINRRGITYQVTVFTCVMDDAHDGARATVNPDVNSAGPYCKGSAASGSTARVDGNPDDYRKVEVSVRWTFSGRTPDCKNAAQTISSSASGTGTACVTQAALIANPAGGLGPAVRSITQVTPSGTIESGNNVTMEVQTAGRAGSVTWSADDGQTGSATAAPGNTDGTLWRFTWTFTANSPKDGAHTVSAQAFLLTAGGVTKEATVLFNRFVPDSPGTVGGGVNRRLTNPAAVLNWAQLNENDVFGYTVYRASGLTPDPTTDTPVCSTTSVADVLCIDAVSDLASVASTTAPCPVAADTGVDLCVDYYAVPFDKRAASNPSPYTTAECPSMTPWTSVTPPTPPVASSRSIAPITGTPNWSTSRAGCPSRFIAVNYTKGLAHAKPDPPTTPISCTVDNGFAVIGWTPPATPGSQYRIYRDPASSPPAYNASATTINFGTSPNFVNSFKDSTPTGGTGHTYYVSVVDDQFGESDTLQINWTAGGCV